MIIYSFITGALLGIGFTLLAFGNPDYATITFLISIIISIIQTYNFKS